MAELGPGELFGEMTCMNYYPRSATVRAETDCTMLEMLRNVLDVLQKSKVFRAQLDETYRRRALDSHLRNVSIFRGLKQDFIDHLRDRVELLRFAPGQVICKQGDPADSFYLVRLGFVKVSEGYPGGELVLAYFSRGDYFGEIGLLGGGDAHGGLLGARPRRGGAHFRGRFSRDGGTVSRGARAAWNAPPANARRRIASACAWCAACRSNVFSRRG